MKIKWLGHAAFLITAANGVRVITDPYQSGSYGGSLKYGPIKESADIVTISHSHPDHGYIEDIDGDPRIIDKVVNNFEFKGIKITGFKVFHDHVAGARRGENIIFIFELEELRVCHLGDLGHMLSIEQLTEIKPVNVLMIPVGGTFTIDAVQAGEIVGQLEPELIIPMHFHNEKCLFSIDPIDNFLFGKTHVVKRENSEIKVTAANLPAVSEIVVLQPEL